MIDSLLMKLYDISTEQALIGSILIEGKLFEEIIGILDETDFYKESHQIIFSTISKLFKKNKGIDLVILTEELNKTNLLEKIGGVTYLTNLINSVPTTANLHHYVKITKDYSYKRTVLSKINKFKTENIDAQKLVEDIVNIPKYEEIKEKSSKDIILETIDDAQRGTDFQFGETFEDINKIIGGVDRGDLIVIGGFSSNGKSSLAVNFAIDFCQDEKRVLFCTLEMPPKAVMRRILAHNNRINTMRFRIKNGLTEEDKSKIKTNIDIIDKIWNYNCIQVYTVPDIIRAVNKYKPEILLIDYLQNISGDDNLSFYAKRTKHVMEIQRLAREQNITIFLLSQFNRPQDGKIGRPHNSNLRDSGAIEERADIIFLIYWERKLRMESLYRQDGEDPEYMEINVTKSKDGMTGGLGYNFYPEYHRLLSPDKDDKQPIIYKKAKEISGEYYKRNQEN